MDAERWRVGQGILILVGGILQQYLKTKEYYMDFLCLCISKGNLDITK